MVPGTAGCTRCTVLHSSPPGALMAPLPPPGAEGLYRLRSPRGLAVAVVALLAAVAAADLLAVVSEVNLLRVYGDAEGSFVVLDGLRTAENLDTVATSLQILTNLATAVVFLVWFHRVRRNAEVFDAGAQPMKPGWAIGAWFVPIANLWLPRRVAGGIWEASVLPGGGPGRRADSPLVLNLWWGVWIFDLVFGRFASRQYTDAVVAEDIVEGLRLLLVSDALDAVAAVLAILFVRRLTAMQGERATALAAQVSSGGPVPA
ncbi:DUF4328 domain-containing protein [Streptomyces nitrosporeus]|uniref:DUF4328 domain-containing protein n=1 Tax=Streptomyces nitrosporeus TaxID=28894 RepID=UPI003325B983